MRKEAIDKGSGNVSAANGAGRDVPAAIRKDDLKGMGADVPGGKPGLRPETAGGKGITGGAGGATGRADMLPSRCWR